MFKGDRSLDKLFSRLLKRLKLFWTSHMSSYLIGSIRYPDIWEVHNNLSLSNKLEKVGQDCRLLKKSPIWLFLAFMDFSDASLEVLTGVSKNEGKLQISKSHNL